MAYTWTNGEVITAEKLNQTGGGGGIQIVNLIYNEDDDDGSYTLDGNEATIQASLLNGVSMVFKGTRGSTTMWYYPTAIDNGSLTIVSCTTPQGIAGFTYLMSNGNGLFA